MEYDKSYEQTEAEREECARIYARHEGMRSARTTLESHWQECMDFIIPRKGDITSSRTDGDKRGNELFDSTAIMSNQLLAGALHSMLTNQSSKFFELVMGDPMLDDDDDVKKWLQDVADKMHMVMNGSNFQTEIHEVYLDIGAIGTACMYIGDHKDRVVHFSARPMKEVYAQENNLGFIDIIHREFEWTPRQIVMEFGEEGMNPDVMKLYEQGRDDKLGIIHCVDPDDSKEKYFKFKERYMLKDKKAILKRDGYKEFPFVVPRWTKTSGEVYGRGPGMDVLPDTKMVNKMMETTIKGAQVTVFPPYQVQDDSVIGRVRLTPGGLTVVRPGIEEPIKALITDARIDFGYQVMEDVRKRIRSGFYTDQILLNQGPQKTATEVTQIVEEQYRFMGPVVGRQHSELLAPTVERVFGIMNRRGMIPEAPAKIAGKAFSVRYSSLIARIQRMSEGQNLTRAIQVAAPIINALPETLDGLSGDRSFKYIMDIHGVPQKVLSTSKEMKDKRDSRQKGEEQAAQERQQQHAADMVQKAGPSMVQAQQQQQQVKQ